MPSCWCGEWFGDYACEAMWPEVRRCCMPDGVWSFDLFELEALDDVADVSSDDVCVKACWRPVGPSGLAACVGALPVVIHGNYDP